MPIYKSTETINKIETPAMFKGEDLVFGNNVFIQVDGGTVTYDGRFKIHTFTTAGTSSLTLVPSNLSDNNSIEYLIQAGGGSGARIPNATTFASAGGAGAIMSGSYTPTIGGSFEVIVGAGGANPGGTNYDGENGKNSSLFGITACSGSGGIRNNSGGGNCYFSGSSAGNFNNGAGASNQANAIDNGGALDAYINSGSISNISGTPTEYGRGGRRYNQFDLNIKGAGGNGGNSSNDSTVGNDGVVIIRYRYK